MPTGWTRDPYSTYIGRARAIEGRWHNGYFGNPYVKGQNCPVCGTVHQQAESTLICYEKWLRGKIAVDLTLRANVKALLGQHLVCYCKPNPCHGDILAKVCLELNS
jgi:hypothetical protein